MANQWLVNIFLRFKPSKMFSLCFNSANLDFSLMQIITLPFVYTQRLWYYWSVFRPCCKTVLMYLSLYLSSQLDYMILKSKSNLFYFFCYFHISTKPLIWCQDQQTSGLPHILFLIGLDTEVWQEAEIFYTN